MSLYPNLVLELVEGMTLMDMPVQDMFAKARDMKALLPVAPLEEQLKDMNAPEEMKGLLQLLLSLDGPSSAAVLESPEYLALWKATSSRKVHKA